MLRIGDFSRLVQLPTATLRYYDELGLLKPAHVDRSNEYRLYRVEQVETLYRIRALQDLGLSLNEVARVLTEAPDVESLEEMMARSVAALERQLADTRQRQQRAALRLAQLRNSRAWPQKEVVVKAAAPIEVASLRVGGLAMAEIGIACETGYCQLYASARKAGWKLACAAPCELTLYHNDSYTETDIEMEVCAVLVPGLANSPVEFEGVRRRTLPGHSRMAAMIHRGSFDLLEQTVIDLFGWVAAQGMEAAGPLRELHLFGRVAGRSDHPADFALELQVPIQERSSV